MIFSLKFQHFWVFSMMLHVIEIINVIPKMSEHFKTVKPDGSTFSALSTLFAFALFLLVSIWTSVSKEQSLIKANNRILSLPHGRLSKRVRELSTVFYITFCNKI